MDKYDYPVHNYMEEIVAELIRVYYEKNSDVCNCHRCVADVNALVLNNVKPQYIRVKTMVDQNDQNLLANLKEQVATAYEKVAANPRHDDDSGTENIFLENLSERLVKQVLADVLQEKKDLDFDQDMLSIIAGLVLNQVEPRYAVTDKGGAFMRLAEIEHQFYPATVAIIYNVLSQLGDLE